MSRDILEFRLFDFLVTTTRVVQIENCAPT